MPPLPDCQGPKLSPFTSTTHTSIDFMFELGDADENKHSFVWHIIDGASYALKMVGPFRAGIQRSAFSVRTCSIHLTETLLTHLYNNFKFFFPDQCWDMAKNLPNNQTCSDQDFINYLDPFNCECRAYGLIKEKNREDIVIPALGYIYLDEAQEDFLTRHYEAEQAKYCDVDDELMDIRNRRGRRDLGPVRAIVKELANPGPCFTPEHVPKMADDMIALHEMGILVRDIHEANYQNSRLLDLSMAWTLPHPFLQEMEWSAYRDERTIDPVDLRLVIRRWIINHSEEGRRIEEPDCIKKYNRWKKEDLGKSFVFPDDVNWVLVETPRRDGTKIVIPWRKHWLEREDI